MVPILVLTRIHICAKQEMVVLKESKERERPNGKYESSKILPRKEENKLSNERECQ